MVTALESKQSGKTQKTEQAPFSAVIIAVASVGRCNSVGGRGALSRRWCCRSKDKRRRKNRSFVSLGQCSLLFCLPSRLDNWSFSLRFQRVSPRSEHAKKWEPLGIT